MKHVFISLRKTYQFVCWMPAEDFPVAVHACFIAYCKRCLPPYPSPTQSWKQHQTSMQCSQPTPCSAYAHVLRHFLLPSSSSSSSSLSSSAATTHFACFLSSTPPIFFLVLHLSHYPVPLPILFHLETREPLRIVRARPSTSCSQREAKVSHQLVGVLWCNTTQNRR